MTIEQKMDFLCNNNCIFLIKTKNKKKFRKTEELKGILGRILKRNSKIIIDEGKFKINKKILEIIFLCHSLGFKIIKLKKTGLVLSSAFFRDYKKELRDCLAKPPNSFDVSFYNLLSSLCTGNFRFEELKMELTYDCNLSCPHCYNKLRKRKAGVKLLAVEDYFKILGFMKGKIDKVRFTGGEALLRKEVFEIAGISKNFGFRNGLNTNGRLVDSHIQDINRHFDDVYISVRSLKELSDYRGIIPKFENVSVTFSIVLSESNIGAIIKDFKEIEKFEFDYFMLLPIIKNEKFFGIDTRKLKRLYALISEHNEKYKNKRIYLGHCHNLNFSAYPFLRSIADYDESYEFGDKVIVVDPFGSIRRNYISNKIYGNIIEIINKSIKT